MIEEILLSLIIPAYECYEYADRLLKKINEQIQEYQEKVEVILVDDGSSIPYQFYYRWLKTVRLNENSNGASVPRNVGLDIAKGEYITFIDIDDTISDDYIETILNKIQSEDFDYCYFGWKSTHFTVLIEDEPPQWNCCVWNCIYKKEMIGNNRFNPELRMAEDFNFNQKVRKGKKAIIPKILYYYNDLQPNSLTKQSTLFNEKYYKSEVM